MVVFSRNPVYSVIFLVMTFFTIACHYLLMSATFLAAVHVIVYAGAIMVLFLYVIMMMNLNDQQEEQKSMLMKIIAVITGGLLFVILVGALKSVDNTAYINTDTTATIGTVKNLGKVLLGEFLLPFETVSILLLTSMVGAVLLGKTHRKKKHGRRENVKDAVDGSGIKQNIEKVTLE